MDAITGLRPLSDLMKPAAIIVIAVLRRCRQDDLKGALQSLGETVLQQVTEAQRDQGGEALPPQSLDLLKRQISELWKLNNPVRTLIGQPELKRLPWVINWRPNERQMMKKHLIFNETSLV